MVSVEAGRWCCSHSSQGTHPVGDAMCSGHKEWLGIKGKFGMGGMALWVATMWECRQIHVGVDSTQYTDHTDLTSSHTALFRHHPLATQWLADDNVSLFIHMFISSSSHQMQVVQPQYTLSTPPNRLLQLSLHGETTTSSLLHQDVQRKINKVLHLCSQHTTTTTQLHLSYSVTMQALHSLRHDLSDRLSPLNCISTVHSHTPTCSILSADQSITSPIHQRSNHLGSHTSSLDPFKLRPHLPRLLHTCISRRLCLTWADYSSERK